MTFEEWLQTRLNEHGFNCGQVDGRIGLKTRKALKKFQKSEGLAQTGEADAETVTALRGEPQAAALTEKPFKREAGTKTAASATANNWPLQRNVDRYYGRVGTNQVKIEVPYDMVLAWDTGIRLKTMMLNARCADSAKRVLEKVAQTYSREEIVDLGLNLFGGSLNVRRMRGGSSWSMHSWGIAIDFDPARNQLRWDHTRARLAQEDAEPFWKLWEEEGWVSLGRARDYDWMHVQAARIE